jgi:hypothetical protein
MNYIIFLIKKYINKSFMLCYVLLHAAS